MIFVIMYVSVGFMYFNVKLQSCNDDHACTSALKSCFWPIFMSIDVLDVIDDN